MKLCYASCLGRQASAEEAAAWLIYEEAGLLYHPSHADRVKLSESHYPNRFIRVAFSRRVVSSSLLGPRSFACLSPLHQSRHKPAPTPALPTLAPPASRGPPPPPLVACPGLGAGPTPARNASVVFTVARGSDRPAVRDRLRGPAAPVSFPQQILISLSKPTSGREDLRFVLILKGARFHGENYLLLGGDFLE